MSGKDSFLEDERKNIEKTVIMIENLSAKTDLSKYEVIALGTLLQTKYRPYLIKLTSGLRTARVTTGICLESRTGKSLRKGCLEDYEDLRLKNEKRINKNRGEDYNGKSQKR